MADLSVELEVKKLREVQKALEGVANEIAKSGNLVARAGLAIERQAKINATGRPGPKVQTGRLRASITPEVLNPELARVGTNVYYASYVELGHKQTLGKGVVNVPAYPFLFPAIDQCKEELGGLMVTYGNELGVIWQQ